MIYNKVLASTVKESHWTQQTPHARKKPIKFNKEDITTQTAPAALLSFFNKIGLKTDPLPESINVFILDRLIDNYALENTRFKPTVIRKNFQDLKSFFQKNSLPFPTLTATEITPPTETTEEFETITSWSSPLIKKRITTLPKSDLTPVLLPNGLLVYKDNEDNLKIRMASESGLIDDNQLTLPEGHGVPTRLKHENNQLIIVDNKGNLFTSTLKDIQTQTKRSVHITQNEATPLKDLIIHGNTLISLYENGTLAITSSSKDEATGQITNERIRIPLDTKHKITAIKLDPEKNALLFSVMDNSGYSEIKKMDLDPKSVKQTEIIESGISGEVHQLNPTQETLYFQVESNSLGGLVTSNSVYAKTLQAKKSADLLSTHTTKIAAVTLLDESSIATGANDIHIIDTNKTTSKGMFSNSSFTQINYIKFENVAGREKEKGSTLQLFTDGTKISTLRQLEDDSYAVFELTQQN